MNLSCATHVVNQMYEPRHVAFCNYAKIIIKQYLLPKQITVRQYEFILTIIHEIH